MDEYIKVLEAEIKEHRYDLDNYISRRAWSKAAFTEMYISGLAQALHLAMAHYAGGRKVK
jgi:hypothetical protein